MRKDALRPIPTPVQTGSGSRSLRIGRISGSELIEPPPGTGADYTELNHQGHLYYSPPDSIENCSHCRHLEV